MTSMAWEADRQMFQSVPWLAAVRACHITVICEARLHAEVHRPRHADVSQSRCKQGSR